jgi:hypothetical protein
MQEKSAPPWLRSTPRCVAKLLRPKFSLQAKALAQRRLQFQMLQLPPQPHLQPHPHPHPYPYPYPTCLFSRAKPRQRAHRAQLLIKRVRVTLGMLAKRAMWAVMAWKA